MDALQELMVFQQTGNKFLWINIKSTLTDSIIYSLKNGTLSIEQKRGIITLLPKKNKNRLELKNWRPLSLLNTDYKILRNY